MVPFMRLVQSRMHGLKKKKKSVMIKPGVRTSGFFTFYIIFIEDITMIFDTHTHYDDNQFDEDREDLLLSLGKNGVGAVANMGASMKGAKDSVALAKSYPFVYAAVGIHPDHTKELNEEEFSVLTALTEEDKVVAIGEIGLDYYWDATEREVQKYWFKRQLALAQEKKLPVVIHSRDAAADTLNIMKEAYVQSGRTLTGVIHCFSYETEMAKEYLKMGFYLGIGGVATFKNGRKLKEVIEDAPLNRMVLETDCPYLAPVPFRGKRNSSEKLSYVVTEVANIKGVPEEEVERITWENACNLYRLQL